MLFDHSPRIQPLDPAKSANGVKREVKALAFKHVAKFLNKKGYVLLDIDIKSCFMSMLLGLYPDLLQNFKKKIEGGVWNYFKESVVSAGKEVSYNKSIVKVCLYASFFGGGKKAFSSQMEDFCREDIGYTQGV